MSKVKINNAQFDEIQTHIFNAQEKLRDTMEGIWGTNFDNLYANFIKNGFLDDLYRDAESSFSKVMKSCSFVGCVGTGVAAASHVATLVTTGAFCASIPVVGWIAAGVLALIGIVMIVANWNSVNFDYAAKEAFQLLLESCVNGNDDCYISLLNMDTKLENCKLSMQEILFLINEFNVTYSNLQTAMNEMNLKGSYADDGMTLLGINTEITIDGKTIELSTSEALNAFYTYENTVMSAMIQADILERTYGYDIDYNAIVEGANAFMVDTIESGLYSHEFIDALLPNYTPDESAALDALVSGATNVDSEDLKSMLESVSNLTLMPGLGLVAGAIVANAIVSPTTPTTPTDNNEGGNTPTNPTTPSGSSGGTPSSPYYPSSPTDPSSDTGDDNKEDDDEDEDSNEDENTAVEIEEISDTEIPESVSNEEEVDYDALAKEKFEFETDYEELIKHRSEIIAEVEAKYESGDLDSLREKLKEYGYNNAEIEAILADRFMTIKAIVQGDQAAQIAQIANELAKEAGVENFVSKYTERPDYSLLEDDGPSDALMLASEDEGVVELYNEMKEAKESYNQVIEETNEVLKEVTDNKTAMEEIQTKYEEKYGEDTTKWTEEAANEYNEAIKTYNESVEKATEQLKVYEESKTAYETAKKEFTDAREAYYEKQRNGESTSDDTSNVTEDTGNSSDTGVTGDDKPYIDESTIHPNTDGIVYLDGSGASDTGNVSSGTDSIVVGSSLDDQIMLTEDSMIIK